MEEIISKEELEEIRNLKGKIRGVAIKGELEFILKAEGEEALNTIEEIANKNGYPLEYGKIKDMAFYPLSLYILMQVLMHKLFGYGQKEFREKGRFLTRVSLIIRLFTQYFVSIDNIATQVPAMWRKYYTVGNLEVSGIDKEKGEGTLRLKDYVAHPMHLESLKGFFAGVLQMVVNKETTCQEIKSPTRGDPYYEFLLKW
ncbi:MAG: hypothetical protein GF370_00090 [Candidatus Nealsonbacteria bacterium]|nr:hypothetical protein [Candidatus Nealsonbacteria bacterium]